PPRSVHARNASAIAEAATNHRRSPTMANVSEVDLLCRFHRTAEEARCGLVEALRKIGDEELRRAARCRLARELARCEETCDLARDGARAVDDDDVVAEERLRFALDDARE